MHLSCERGDFSPVVVFHPKVMETSPTIGFNVGDLDLDKKTSLTVWDVGGQKSMRANWR